MARINLGLTCLLGSVLVLALLFVLVSIQRGDFDISFFSDEPLINAIVFSLLSATAIVAGILSLTYEKSSKSRRLMAIIGLGVTLLTVLSSLLSSAAFYRWPFLP